MRKLGMTDAPPEATAAVFAYFDHDESGTVEYRKLHAIIKRSLQDRPVLAPLLPAAYAFGPGRDQAPTALGRACPCGARVL